MHTDIIMAEGGELGTSDNEASDILIDLGCSICEENCRTTEAVFYCAQCDKRMCMACSELHRQLYLKHVIYDQDNIGKWGRKSINITMDMCEVHSDKEAELFCHDHNDVCCYICTSTKHRACGLVQHIPDVAKGIHQKPEFQEMLVSVSNLQEQLNEMRQKKHSNSQYIRQASTEILSAINALRQKIVEILDDLEQNAKQILDEMVEKAETMLKRDMDACKFVHDELKKIHDNTRNRNMSDESSAFRAYKACGKKSKEAKEFLHSLQTSKDITLTFTPNSEVENVLSLLKSFGTMTINPPLTDSSSTTEITAGNHVKSLYCKTHEYSVENVTEYDVRIGSDTEECVITGVCVLPDGNYVIADMANETVKLLNDKYSVIEECDLIGRPQDVCHITDGIVAVTAVQTDSKIHILSTNEGKLTKARSVTLDHNCHGIAYHNGGIYVGSDEGLYVYGVDCRQIRKLYSQPVFYVAVGNDGKRIYATHNYSLVTLDHSGNKLSSLNNIGLNVTVVGHGNVCCCGYYKNKIQQVEKKGRKQLNSLEILQNKSVAQQALCFNSSTSELIIGQRSDILLVLTLK